MLVSTFDIVPIGRTGLLNFFCHHLSRFSFVWIGGLSNGFVRRAGLPTVKTLCSWGCRRRVEERRFVGFWADQRAQRLLRCCVFDASLVRFVKRQFLADAPSVSLAAESANLMLLAHLW